MKLQTIGGLMQTGGVFAGPYAPIVQGTGMALTAIGGIIEADKMKKKLEQERIYEEQHQANLASYGQSIGFNSSGTSGKMFALGGKLTKPIGDSAVQITGAGTHESGNDVQLTTNGQAPVRVEQGEVIDTQTDAVYSSRLGTADAVAPLIQQRDALQQKIQSEKDKYKQNGLKLQLEAVNQKIDSILNAQQAANGNASNGTQIASDGMTNISGTKNKFTVPTEAEFFTDNNTMFRFTPNVTPLKPKTLNDQLGSPTKLQVTNSFVQTSPSLGDKSSGDTSLGNTSITPDIKNIIGNVDLTKAAPYLDVAANAFITARRPNLTNPVKVTPGVISSRADVSPVINNSLQTLNRTIDDINKNVTDPQQRIRMINDANAKHMATVAQANANANNINLEVAAQNAAQTTQANAQNANIQNTYNVQQNALTNENLNDFSAIVSNAAGKMARNTQQLSALALVLQNNPAALTTLEGARGVADAISNPDQAVQLWQMAKGKGYETGIKQYLQDKFPNLKFE